MAYNKKRTYKKKTATPKPLRGWKAKADLGVFGKYEVGNLYKRSLPAMIKSVVDGDKEVKRKLLSTISVNLLHYGHFQRNILGNISQGTSTIQRESEELKLNCLKGAFQLRSQWSGQEYPTSVRIMMVRSKLEVGAASDAYASSLGAADLYLNSVTSANGVNSLIDPKKVQLLFDKTIILGFTNASTNPYKQTVNVPFDISLQHDFVYKTGSNYGNKYNYYWVMIAHSPGAVVGSTNLVTVEEDSQLIFRDK